MDKLIEFLKKVEAGEDEALVFVTRFYSNLKVAEAILKASRAQDLGATTNAVLDEFIVVVDKLIAVVGTR